MDTKKILIICITVIAIVAIGTFTFLNSNINGNEIVYVNEQFDGFSMDVPSGTLFKKVDVESFGQESYVSDGTNYMKVVAYKNKGNYSENITGLMIMETSFYISSDNVTQADGGSITPLNAYLYSLGDRVENDDQETYMNTSNILVRGKNTTSGRIYQGIYSDNGHHLIMVGGNNLDLIKNVIQTVELTN